MTNIHDYFEEKLATNDKQPSLIGPAAYTDQALAARFTDQYGQDLKFVNDWGRWLVWDKTWWRLDGTQQVMHLCRMVAKEALSEINWPPSLVKTVGSASRGAITNAEWIFSLECAIIFQDQEWAGDPTNLPNRGKVVLDAAQPYEQLSGSCQPSSLHWRATCKPNFQ